MVAPVPSNEEKRIASLRSLNLLDTPPEERFDRITRVAAELFGVPIALISLVDSDRQWFKSCYGITISETPRDISFCAHAILGDDIFYVPDTKRDPRFADSPLVSEQSIRFYAGLPLTGPEEQIIGTLCIMDNVPREITEEDKRLLRDLGAWAHAEITALHLLKREVVSVRDRLKETEETFSKFLDGLPVGVFVLDADGTPSYVNQTAEQILGKGIIAQDRAEQIPNTYNVFLEGTDQKYPAEKLPIVRALKGMSTEAEDIDIHRPEGVMSVQVWATPIFNEHGEITHAIAAFQDITERKRTEKRVATQHRVTLVLSESRTTAEAIPKILEAICESMNWSVGALWRVDVISGLLRCVEFWHKPNYECPDFEGLTRRLEMANGMGLPGRVWLNGEPAWIPNIVEDSNFPRTPAAMKNGLHAAFAFPVRFQNEVIGVVEFFNRQIQEPDRELLSMLNSLGMQIGQFLGRKQIEEMLDDARERYRRLSEKTL
jgi:two-component system, sensor histidine kinase and response regulator